MPEIYVASVDDIADGTCRVISDGALEIGVFRLGDAFFAWENSCPHMGGPVCQGKVMKRVTEVLDDDRRSHGWDYTDDHHIVCPWHGYEFNIRTGAHPADADTRLRGFATDVRDGAVYVRV